MQISLLRRALALAGVAAALVLGAACDKTTTVQSNLAPQTTDAPAVLDTTTAPTLPPTTVYVAPTTVYVAPTTVYRPPATAAPSCPNGTYTNSSGHVVCSPYASPSGPPAGASAKCNDGTYSFSEHRQGTCSGHGGVAEWY